MWCSVRMSVCAFFFYIQAACAFSYFIWRTDQVPNILSRKGSCESNTCWTKEKGPKVNERDREEASYVRNRYSKFETPSACTSVCEYVWVSEWVCAIWLSYGPTFIKLHTKMYILKTVLVCIHTERHARTYTRVYLQAHRNRIQHSVPSIVCRGVCLQWSELVDTNTGAHV